MSLQKSCMRESQLIVNDEGRRRHLFKYNPLQLLFYVVGLYPMKLCGLYDNSQVGPVAVKPIKLMRDDLVTIYRTEVEYSPETMDKLIEYLLKVLSDDNLLTLQRYLQARLVGLENNETYRQIIEDVDSMDLLKRSGKGKGGEWMKYGILETWFESVDGIWNGPTSQTRAIFYDDAVGGVQSRYEGPIMNEIYNLFEEIKKDDQNVGYLVLFDDKHYIIPKASAMKMEFPDVVDVDYVEMCATTDHVENYNEIMVSSICEVADLYKIHVLKQTQSMEESKHRIRLIANDGVFDEMVKELRKIINSRDFMLWTERTNLVVWAGRDEQNKLDDIRKMKAKHLAAEKENKRLKALIKDNQ